MPREGKRPGAGRKPGRLNKRTIAHKQLAVLPSWVAAFTSVGFRDPRSRERPFLAARYPSRFDLDMG